jgi:ATP-dependent Lon protease
MSEKEKEEIIENGQNISALPMIPVRGLVVFPQMSVHFDIGRDKSIKALNKALERESLIFLVAQKNSQIAEPSVNQVYKTGTVSKIKQVLKLPGENVRVLVQGLYRAEIERFTLTDEYFEAEVVPLKSENNDKLMIEAYRRNALNLFDNFTKLDVKISPELTETLKGTQDPDCFIDILAANVVYKEKEKQEILEEKDLVMRFTRLCGILAEEIEILKIEKKINGKVKLSIDKSQKEYYLREQIKAINEELGESDEEVQSYVSAVKKLKMPKESEKKVLKEISRLSKMASSSPEAAVIRNYADWVCELPWNRETKDNTDLIKAKEILDGDHYGMAKAKERILEFLAVHTLTKSLKGPILCFVGPPGVGKTSIAKSIAKALNRNYVRMSLGGVKDEAEIRGHRRTYIGAMPGRILYHMKNAGSINPVFLLDEIDKMSSDFRGDPASAMLEVLDPEQNNTFRDHFLEIPYDLSKVLFITTANTIENIPLALLDRMEVIQLSGYTEDEKLEIAKRYLLPKQAQSNGISLNNIEISDDIIRLVIQNYTRESGVRSLEREIGSICRRIAREFVEKNSDLKTSKQIVDAAKLEEYLGIPKFRNDEKSETDQIGAATGLAWTSVGGTALTIEVQVMKGKGEIVLTGHLGDVMKESARTALSFIRSQAEEYNIAPEVFTENDIHIHVPEGAVPKDGPSAGITIATAIFSALTKKAVSKDVAMTGEITLRGKVLPIGGLKEKTLAAHRMGIKTVLIPRDNEKDMAELPDKIKQEINLVLVDNINTVLQQAISHTQSTI